MLMLYRIIAFVYVFCVLGRVQTQTPQQQAVWPPPGYVFKICISSWAPFVFVSEEEVHSGYDWDLFQVVARRMGLRYKDEETESWDAMLKGLTIDLDNDTHCDIAPTGIPYDAYAFTESQLTEKVAGTLLSVPTLRGGFGLVTRVSRTEPDMWSFTRVFSNDLWATIVLTAVFLAIVVWWSERSFYLRGLGKVKYPLTPKAGLFEAFYRVFGKLWNVVSDLNVTSVVSKVLSVAWGVATIVLIANYTASLAGYLTAARFTTAVNDVSELKTKRAGTYIAALDRMNSVFGLNLESFYWTTDQDGLDGLNKVRTGEWDAMLMDLPWLRYYTASMCDVTILPDPLTPNYLGWGYNKNLPKELVQQFNQVLLDLQLEGVQEVLEQAWLPSNKCDYKLHGAVTFAMMAGLWIVIAASLGLALLLLAAPHFSKKLEVDSSIGPRSNSIRVARSLMSKLLDDGSSFNNASMRASNSGPSDSSFGDKSMKQSAVPPVDITVVGKVTFASSLQKLNDGKEELSTVKAATPVETTPAKDEAEVGTEEVQVKDGMIPMPLPDVELNPGASLASDPTTYIVPFPPSEPRTPSQHRPQAGSQSTTTKSGEEEAPGLEGEVIMKPSPTPSKLETDLKEEEL